MLYSTLLPARHRFGFICYRVETGHIGSLYNVSFSASPVIIDNIFPVTPSCGFPLFFFLRRRQGEGGRKN